MTLITQIITGKNVSINGFNTGGKVHIVRTSDSMPSFASSQSGGAYRPAGNIDFEGFIWAWGHTPPYFVNQTFTFTFTLNGTNNMTAADVMCTGIDIIVLPNDPTKKNRVYYKLYFACGGTDLANGGTVAPDTTMLVYPSKGLKLYIGSGVTDAECLLHAQMKIRSTAKSDVNSCTNGIYMRPIGNIDWELEYEKRVYDLSLLPALNSIHIVKLCVDGSLGWTLAYGLVDKIEGEFDSSDPTPLSAGVTISKTMNGTDVGYIKTPAGVTLWP